MLSQALEGGGLRVQEQQDWWVLKRVQRFSKSCWERRQWDQRQPAQHCVRDLWKTWPIPVLPHSMLHCCPLPDMGTQPLRMAHSSAGKCLPLVLTESSTS